MAKRNIVTVGDDILTKKCRPVDTINDRIKSLVADMFETLYDANGVGLAAPQVGILRRIAVVDCTGEDPIVLINPEVIQCQGEQTDAEGCLSYPGKYGLVTRPFKVTVKAQNLNGKVCEITGEGLKARALLHEIDHLDGHMFIEKVSEWVKTEEDE